MNILNNNEEIPGYYRDSATGRYYHISNNDANLLPLQRIEENKKRECITQANKKPKKLCISKQISPHPSFLKLLSSKEEGLTINDHFRYEFLRSKLRQMSFANEFELDFSYREGIDYHFLRGSPERLLGVCKDQTGGDLIYNVVYKPNPKCSKSTTIPSAISNIETKILFDFRPTISDIYSIHYDNSDYITLAANNDDGTACLMVMKNQQLFEPFIWRGFFKIPLWCCTNTRHAEFFAAGGEDRVFVSSLDNLQIKPTVKGKVYSIEFNEEGSLIYCGLHTGNLLTYDLRIPSKPSSIHKIGEGKAICDTVLLSDQETMVVSAVSDTGSNSLVKVDLRLKDPLPVITYPGHIKTSPKKIPFSVFESENVICATGSDDITRLWSLNKGELLFTIAPPIQGKKARSCLLHSDKKWFVSIFQEGKVMVYEPQQDISL